MYNNLGLTLGVNTIRRIKDIMSKIKLIVEGKRVKQQLFNVVRKFRGVKKTY